MLYSLSIIRAWVTDARNNVLDLKGIDVALSLMIEEQLIFSLVMYMMMNHR